MNLSKIIFIFLILFSCAFSQSKTDDAKDKLDNAGDKSDKKEKADSNDEDDGDSIGSTIAKVVFNFFLKETAGLMFNLPLGEEFQSQAVYYYDYPYCMKNNYGIRTSDQFGIIRTQTGITLGKSYDDVFNSYVLFSNINIKSWAVRLRYKYIDENNASYKLHYFSGKIERKSRTFKNTDMGIGAGIDDIKIGKGHYTGFSMGLNLDIFFKYQFSWNLNPGLMFYSDETITDIVTSINYHRNRYFFGIEYEQLNIIGSKFNSLAFRMGFYY